MPWMEHNHMTLRQEFCLLAAVPGTEISALCRRFGISRKTAYKWLGRYQREGAVGLADRSRRPHGHPWQTPAAMVEQVLAVRAQYGWGGRKIHHALVLQGVVEAPSPSTITAILARHDPDDPVTALGDPPAPAGSASSRPGPMISGRSISRARSRSRTAPVPRCWCSTITPALSWAFRPVRAPRSKPCSLSCSTATACPPGCSGTMAARGAVRIMAWRCR